MYDSSQINTMGTHHEAKTKSTILEVQEGSMCQSIMFLIDTTDITEIPLPISVPEQKKVLNIFWCQLMLKEPLL